MEVSSRHSQQLAGLIRAEPSQMCSLRGRDAVSDDVDHRDCSLPRHPLRGKDDFGSAGPEASAFHSAETFGIHVPEAVGYIQAATLLPRID